jgi:ribosomal protein S18 acetylase RimI-like enzyme
MAFVIETPRRHPTARGARANLQSDVIAAPTLSYRTIDPDADADFAIRAYLDACRASYGNEESFLGRPRHLEWLRSRVEEFPDGHLLALLDGRPVGQMELQVPYGLPEGYVNLYYVIPELRGCGFGRRMHDHAVLYFRSWDATRVELHVSDSNERAMGFYRSLGYRAVRREGRLWRMARPL